MSAPRQVPAPASSDDERSLLGRLESLLVEEEALLLARDPDGLATVAEERDRVTARLATAARTRSATHALGAEEEADLLAWYRRLRQRHDVQAQVVRQHAERNARAVGVLAQATGEAGLYKADGRVAMRFLSV